MIGDKTWKPGDIKRPPFFYDYYGMPGDDNLAITTTDALFGNRIFAGGGNDVVWASEGRDSIYGEGGNDVLFGRGGNDYLDGGADNDQLDGGAGADVMVGGTGNDVYRVDDAGDQVTENAGEGYDFVFASISYTLGANIEDLTLDPYAYSAYSATGNDLNNRISGTVFNNYIDGGAGADLMAGGSGDDRYMVDNAGDYVNEGAGGGWDRVYSLVNRALEANVEELDLSFGSAIYGTGNELDNVIRGNATDNTLYGGLGNDTLIGEAGADMLIGGGGVDTASYEWSGLVTANLLTPSSNLGDAAGDTFIGIANLTGSGGPDRLTGDGNANVLRGNAGNDRLDGGAGADTLIGGAGADVFQFRSPADSGSAGAPPDQIVDFLSHRYAMDGDTIDLSAIDANINVAGDQAFVFIGNNNNFVPALGAGQLRCNGGFVEGDVDGDLVADFRIQVFQTDNLLVAADFYL